MSGRGARNRPLTRASNCSDFQLPASTPWLAPWCFAVASKTSPVMSDPLDYARLERQGLMRTRTCLPRRCWGQIARPYGDCDREAEVRPNAQLPSSPTSLDLSAIIAQNFTSVHLALPIRR